MQQNKAGIETSSDGGFICLNTEAPRDIKEEQNLDKGNYIVHVMYLLYIELIFLYYQLCRIAALYVHVYLCTCHTVWS